MKPSRSSVQSELDAIARHGDVVMGATLLVSIAACFLIGLSYDNLALAFESALAVLVATGVVYLPARGSALGRLALIAGNVAAVTLHMQLSRGAIEFHFGVFVLLGLLLVYRDWKPIVVCAALFALQHVAFDRLMALHFGVYCTPEANLPKIVLHAVYVVVQTSIEVYLAIGLRNAAIQAAELAGLVRYVSRDSSIHLDVAGLGAKSGLAQSLKAALLRIEAAMTEVSNAAQFVKQSSQEIAAGTLDLSQRTERQACSLQQTAASIEEISGSAHEATESATLAREQAAAASKSASDGNALVRQVVRTMSEIDESSGRIAEINTMIDSIAFQTNILALNAAVEAARAGDHGRGVAVVASEVRSLAQRSAAAAHEIKQLIAESTSRVETGRDLACSAGGGMDAILQQTGQVARMIDSVAGTAEQQAAVMDQVSNAIAQLDNVTQQNAALVEQNAAAAESLAGQADTLRGVVGQFVLTGLRTATH